MINQNVIDSKLTGNPQITYFKSVYRRHTFFMKFTREYNEKTITITNDGDTYSNTISHGGMDLISDVYYKNKIVNIPVGATVYANLGNNIIHNIKLEVNGKKIYHTTGQIMEMMSELENPYIPAYHNGSLKHPILDGSASASLTVNSGNNYNIMCFAGGVNGSQVESAFSKRPTDTFYSRPDFYFTRSYGSCFPICALYHSDIKIVATFSAWDKIMTTPGADTTLTSNLVIEYINLSQEEKRRVVNNTEPYIYFNIRNHQYGEENSTQIKKSLPIRTIFFVKEYTDTGNASRSYVTPMEIPSTTTITISHNNISKNQISELTKYTRENIYRYYGNNGFGGRNLGAGTGILDSIGMYTQSLEPGQEPNGHFSGDSEIKIDITPSSSTTNLKIYYEYINFYKISSGQLDILFAEV